MQSDSDYANSAAEYTADMVAAMKLVWARAPFLAKGPLIVSGESYAGHYNPHLAAALLKTVLLACGAVELARAGLGRAPGAGSGARTDAAGSSAVKNKD